MSVPTKPRISVCIANFNGADYLDACLASVFAQSSDDFDLEVIVHDDASTDESLQEAARLFSDVVPIYSTRNVGFCISNNRMVERATGEYVLLLNNDAKLKNGALEVLLSNAKSINKPAILTLPQFNWTTGVTVDRGMLLDIFNTPLPNNDTDTNDIAFATGACLWIPKVLWQELGGFPPILESIAEDMYLCSAARACGYRVAALPLESSGFLHHQGASFGGNKVLDGKISTTFRRRRLSERNRTWVALACTPFPLAWPYFIALLAFMPIEGALVSLVTRSIGPFRKIYGPAFVESIRAVPQIVKLRKNLPLSRQAFKYFFSSYRFRLVKLETFRAHGRPRLTK